jgi:F-type H+-transporting ATPase subunit a
VVIPAVFMGLGLFVAFLQAFVFALLTMIYIGQALEEPH